MSGVCQLSFRKKSLLWGLEGLWSGSAERLAKTLDSLFFLPAWILSVLILVRIFSGKSVFFFEKGNTWQHD